MPERLLEHPLRKAILETVHDGPGIPMADLRRRMGCSWGTIYHHINVLSRGGLVRTRRWNGSNRIFPASVPEEEQASLILLSHERIREVVEAVQWCPGIMQRDITDRVNISRKVLRNYVDLLKQEGLLHEVVDHPAHTYFPSEDLGEMLTRIRPERQPVRSWIGGDRIGLK